ncbi:hypothetical protein FHG87_011252 [Trinorchestia longiramus]|nr:hypothetical protein FHG87_011252 [Trinorchestia longiramus]
MVRVAFTEERLLDAVPLGIVKTTANATLIVFLPHTGNHVHGSVSNVYLSKQDNGSENSDEARGRYDRKCHVTTNKPSCSGNRAHPTTLYNEAQTLCHWDTLPNTSEVNISLPLTKLISSLRLPIILSKFSSTQDSSPYSLPSPSLRSCSRTGG